MCTHKIVYYLKICNSLKLDIDNSIKYFKENSEIFHQIKVGKITMNLAVSTTPSKMVTSAKMYPGNYL